MDTRSSSLTAPSGTSSAAESGRAAFRGARLLAGAYLGLSVLTLAVIALFHNHASMVDSAAWVRATIVVASSAVTYLCAVAAERGSRGAYRRLRILSLVMVAAIVVLVALPGSLPLWLKAEQSACGVLLLAIVVMVNGRDARALFGR
jgi:phosphatidylglycerophosphate synthase